MNPGNYSGSPGSFRPPAPVNLVCSPIAQDMSGRLNPLCRGIGVDGCPGGWAAVVVETGRDAINQAAASARPANGPTETVTAAIYPNITSLWAALRPDPAQDLVLIDMPIGLPEGEHGIRNRVSDRHCDRDCRKLLPKSRKSSVFPVPARQALHADDPSSANAAAAGRKLSCQSLNLLPKIRELDDFVAAWLASEFSEEADHPCMLPLIESHPEVAFMRLNGGEAPTHGKKTIEGLGERLGILERAGMGRTDLEHMMKLFPRKQAARDDLLDAAALALTAQRILSKHSPARYVTGGERRQFDYNGRLEMNIVYI